MKLNAYVIPSQAPGGTEGFAYNYDDLNIASETAYYYWLEDVDLSGQVTRHGPVLATPSGNSPTALTLTMLQANSHASSPALWLIGLLGATAVLLLVKRRRAA